MMRENDYADYEPHKRQHEAMIAKVTGFMEAYERTAKVPSRNDRIP